MMAGIKLISLLVVVTLLQPVLSSHHCACEDPESSATFGSAVRPVDGAAGRCTGICDIASQTILKVCIELSGKVDLCDVEQNCSIPSSCTGAWSAWEDVSSCNQPCGEGGTKVQQRRCFKRMGHRTLFNVIDQHCFGGYGNRQQQRNVSCDIVMCTTYPSYGIEYESGRGSGSGSGSGSVSFYIFETNTDELTTTTERSFSTDDLRARFASIVRAILAFVGFLPKDLQ